MMKHLSFCFILSFWINFTFLKISHAENINKIESLATMSGMDSLKSLNEKLTGIIM